MFQIEIIRVQLLLIGKKCLAENLFITVVLNTNTPNEVQPEVHPTYSTEVNIEMKIEDLKQFVYGEGQNGTLVFLVLNI